MKKVGIIIVNWNGWRDTIACLESLQNITYPNFFVYVVDNGSTDESRGQLSRLQIKDLRLQCIWNKINAGFAGGNNVGIREALKNGAEYILLLNNDTIVSGDFLSKLVEAAESSPRIGIIGPKIYFFDQAQDGSLGLLRQNSAQVARGKFAAPQRIWFGGGKLNWLKTRGCHLDYDKIDEGSGRQDSLFSNSRELENSARPISNQMPHTQYEIQDTDYITGCCLLVKKEVIEKIGLLSEEYFLYYEDVDWCLRARNAGYRVVFNPSAYIWHKVSRSAKAGSAPYVYYHVRNGMLLAWRHGTMLARAALFFFILWTMVKQIVKLAIPAKREWGIAALRGIKDFLRFLFLA